MSRRAIRLRSSLMETFNSRSNGEINANAYFEEPLRHTSVFVCSSRRPSLPTTVHQERSFAPPPPSEVAYAQARSRLGSVFTSPALVATATRCNTTRCRSLPTDRQSIRRSLGPESSRPSSTTPYTLPLTKQVGCAPVRPRQDIERRSSMNGRPPRPLSNNVQSPLSSTGTVAHNSVSRHSWTPNSGSTNSDAISGNIGFRERLTPYDDAKRRAPTTHGCQTRVSLQQQQQQQPAAATVGNTKPLHLSYSPHQRIREVNLSESKVGVGRRCSGRTTRKALTSASSGSCHLSPHSYLAHLSTNGSRREHTAAQTPTSVRQKGAQLSSRGDTRSRTATAKISDVTKIPDQRVCGNSNGAPHKQSPSRCTPTGQSQTSAFEEASQSLLGSHHPAHQPRAPVGHRSSTFSSSFSSRHSDAPSTALPHSSDSSHSYCHKISARELPPPLPRAPRRGPCPAPTIDLQATAIKLVQHAKRAVVEIHTAAVQTDKSSIAKPIATSKATEGNGARNSARRTHGTHTPQTALTSPTAHTPEATERYSSTCEAATTTGSDDLFGPSAARVRTPIYQIPTRGSISRRKLKSASEDFVRSVESNISEGDDVCSHHSLPLKENNDVVGCGSIAAEEGDDVERLRSNSIAAGEGDDVESHRSDSMAAEEEGDEDRTELYSITRESHFSETQSSSSLVAFVQRINQPHSTSRSRINEDPPDAVSPEPSSTPKEKITAPPEPSLTPVENIIAPTTVPSIDDDCCMECFVYGPKLCLKHDDNVKQIVSQFLRMISLNPKGRSPAALASPESGLLDSCTSMPMSQKGGLSIGANENAEVSATPGIRCGEELTSSPGVDPDPDIDQRSIASIGSHTSGDSIFTGELHVIDETEPLSVNIARCLQTVEVHSRGPPGTDTGNRDTPGSSFVWIRGVGCPTRYLLLRWEHLCMLFHLTRIMFGRLELNLCRACCRCAEPSQTDSRHRWCMELGNCTEA
eukprot:GHVN01086342.1.p1 GENE.GHVN01086342.1~~GHVN01086342.1.p1  ORF type:complete len:975 (-),score=126.03 GHVN01086342.1:1841-4765(-)